MLIESVFSPAFMRYGKVLEGYDTVKLLDAMQKIDLPSSGTDYRPSIKELEECAIFPQLRDRAYGGMPIQLGMCWGRNTKLNCLEYHRDSELNIGNGDYILLLAKEEEIENGILDTENVRAFRVPAGAVVEVYATTLHYAPCHVNEAEGFRVAVVLPKGTNTELPVISAGNEEDGLLWARNKWLLAHPDSAEAAAGAHLGLKGKNIDLKEDL